MSARRYSRRRFLQLGGITALSTLVPIALPSPGIGGARFLSSLSDSTVPAWTPDSPAHGEDRAARSAPVTSGNSLPRRRPNILFITAHDLGRHLGCYGRQSVRTPALDHLAATGVLFENSYCNAPQCSPSRASLHTGRFPHATGVLGLSHSPFNWELPPDEYHLASILRTAGYETSLFGVQHLMDREHGSQLGYDLYDSEQDAVAAPLLGEKAADFLRDPQRHEHPFYLEVGFFEPHRPFHWGGATADEAQGVELPTYLPDTEEARSEVAALQGAINQLDVGVGTLLAALEEAGLATTTWVVFAADHGLAMPRSKCTLYDPGLEVALIMRWPDGGLRDGRRLPELLSHVDVVPTILDALRLPAPNQLHGRSFWPLLQGDFYKPNRMIFAEKTYHTAYEPMRGVRTSTHKLICNFESGSKIDVPDDVRLGLIYPQMLPQITGQRGIIELYDLHADPQEHLNLAGRPEIATEERVLRNELRRWMEQTDDPLLNWPLPSPFYQSALAALAA